MQAADQVLAEVEGVLKQRVVGFAIVEIAGENWAGLRPPAVIRGDLLGRAVDIGELDLLREREAVAIDVALAAAKAETPPELAVAQHCAKRVTAFMQYGGHFKRLVAQAMVVAGQPGAGT